MIKIKNYIHGALVDPIKGRYKDNIDPSTGNPYSVCPLSDEEDVCIATEYAKKAFESWSAMPVQERSSILLKIADLIDINMDKLALAESRDNGKPLSLARKLDIPRSSANLRFFATAILHFASESHQTDNVALNYTVHAPIGVAGCISPWNLPLYLFTWKIAPALAAGNTVVAKPSEVTPMTAFLFSELCMEAGLPPGVLNIIHGSGEEAGSAIVGHPDVKVISFTGGTETGRKIASAAAPMFKKLSLELGGKNPNIIFEDCDFERALKETVRSSFTNQGQICLCGSRILIQEKLYERFKDSLVKEVKKLKTGNPLNEAVDLGAVVSEEHLRKVLRYIKMAVKEGGRILTGGERLVIEGFENGYYIAPTVIEGLDPECLINQEEIFGPVISLIPFKDVEEAISLANGVKYGLSATIWTDSLQKAHYVASKIECGIVWVNCWLLRDLRTPFGGMKNSGMGREGGFEVLKFFTETKNVCIKL